MPIVNRNATLATISAAFLLAACASTPPAPPAVVQQQPPPGDPSLADQGAVPLLSQKNPVRGRQGLHEHESGVVPGAFVTRSRVAETDDDAVERHGA